MAVWWRRQGQMGGERNGWVTCVGRTAPLGSTLWVFPLEERQTNSGNLIRQHAMFNY